MPETENQTETVETVTQNEPGVIEQIGQILRPEEKTDDVVTETQAPESQVQEQPQVNSQELIDDSFLEKYPSLKYYRGKPIESIAGGYEKLVKTLNNQSQEINKLKQQITSNSKKKASDFSDSVEHPQKFEQELADFETQIREDERNRIASQPQQPNLVNEIKESLPEGVDVQKVIDGWVGFNSAMIFNEYGERRPEVTQFYNQNPEILVRQITDYYTLASRAEKNEMQIKTEGKNLAYNNVKDSLRKANQNRENIPNAIVNAIPRNQENLSETDELLVKIRSKLPHNGT